MARDSSGRFVGKGKEGDVTIAFSRFKEVRDRFPAEVARIRKATALQIDGLIKRNIVASDIIDTGFLLNSVYIADEDGSSYASAQSAASSRNAAGTMAPEVEPGDGETVVGMGAAYAAPIEFGAHNEDGSVRTDARPFFIPAVEEGRALYLANMQKLKDKL